MRDGRVRARRRGWSAGALAIVILSGCGSTVARTEHAEVVGQPQQVAGVSDEMGTGLDMTSPANTTGAVGGQSEAGTSSTGAGATGAAVAGTTANTGQGPPSSTGADTTGAAAGQTTGNAGQGPASSAPPTTGTSHGPAAAGRGWTADEVFVGVGTQQDASDIGNALGYESFDFGDQGATIQAAVNALNERGGILGRRLVPVIYDVNTTQDEIVTSEEACQLWTQDQPVAMVFVGLETLATPQLFQCLHNAGVPTLAGYSHPSLASEINQFGPEIQLIESASMERLADPWVSALESLDYFASWDTLAGGPGVAPVKVGILHRDEPRFDEAWGYVETRLEARGVEVVDSLAYASTEFASLQGYVLRFHSDQVTHIFLDFHAGLFFMQQAESQGYRPRYALSSYNFLQPFVMANAPAAQLNGLAGVGWLPLLDVDEAQAPPATAEMQQCLDDMSAAGIDLSKQNYRYVAYGACDIDFIRFAAEAANDFAPIPFITGVRSVVGEYPWRSHSGGRAVEGDPTLLGGIRALYYDTGCACLQYAGPLTPL